MADQKVNVGTSQNDTPRYPDCSVDRDTKDRWLLYTDRSHEAVIAIFYEKRDAEAAQRFFSRG